MRLFSAVRKTVSDMVTIVILGIVVCVMWAFIVPALKNSFGSKQIRGLTLPPGEFSPDQDERAAFKGEVLSTYHALQEGA